MAENVAIIGSGYVGLTTAVALAYLGHRVTCVDLDEAKIAKLRKGHAPFFEPGLEALLGRVSANLSFTSSYAEAIPSADVVFIAVGTPSMPDGRPDLQYVQAAATEIGRNLGDKFTVLINKSTVPIGSGNWVEMIVRDALVGKKRNFAVASNPEFLREGSALHDTFYPDRIVVGADDANAVAKLSSLYRALLDQSFVAPEGLPRPAGLAAVPFVTTDLASAELIKYASNAFLALKISYINEIAELAERVGADVTRVAAGIGLDARIGRQFLHAGIGWGGSCFGKDTAALLTTAQEYQLTMPIVAAAREVNYRQRARIVEKLRRELKILKGRSIGLLGLAFKPQTDDLRDAPALDLAQKLIEAGAKVRVHDPVAMPNALASGKQLGVEFCDHGDHVANEADAIVLVTEWPEYRSLPWEKMAAQMRTPIVIDGRNFLERDRLTACGFRCVGMGI
jgi:UDPglucose 6-dehydrogenase